MKPSTQRLIARFRARRLMLLDHLPRRDVAASASLLSRYRSDIAKAHRKARVNPSAIGEIR